MKRRTKAWMVVGKAPKSGDWCIIAPFSMVDGGHPIEAYRTREDARSAAFSGEKVVRVVVEWMEPK